MVYHLVCMEFCKLHLTQVQKWHLGTGLIIRHCVIYVLHFFAALQNFTIVAPASISVKNIKNDYICMLNVSINREVIFFSFVTIFPHISRHLYD